MVEMKHHPKFPRQCLKARCTKGLKWFLKIRFFLAFFIDLEEINEI